VAIALFILAGFLALGAALVGSGATAPRTDVGADLAGMMFYAGAACWVGALFLASLGFALRRRPAKGSVSIQGT
jgi:hypothetical protein